MDTFVCMLIISRGLEEKILQTAGRFLSARIDFLSCLMGGEGRGQGGRGAYLCGSLGPRDENFISGQWGPPADSQSSNS